MPFEKIAYRVSAASRRKKYGQFLSLVSPSPEETILDVGVNVEEYSITDNYLEKSYPYPEKITAVGTGDISSLRERYPETTFLQADGRALPFRDEEFSISYSNAVVEHVGSPSDQVSFLRELYRVSGRGYLTTPNRLFPIEVHTRLPLLHLLLPKPAFDAVLRALGKGWAAGDYMRLLSETELRARLDEAGIKGYTIHRNRFCGLVMTFTVVWKKPIHS